MRKRRNPLLQAVCVAERKKGNRLYEQHSSEVPESQSLASE